VIRVLIVDDHPLVREGLRRFLALEPDFDVAEAPDGETAATLAASFLPHVVLMDLILPTIDGVEATARVLEVSPDSKVVILTSLPDDDRVLPAIRAGALSYLLKDVSADDLIRAVRDAAKGKSTFHPLATERLMHAVKGPDTDADPTYALTARELEVLGCIGRGLNNREIADELYISERTVKAHVSSLLAKLDCADRTNLAIYAIRNRIA